MTIPKNILEKAIEGGWERPSFFALNDDVVIADLEDAHTALDPTFWQALEKAGVYTKLPRTVDPWKRTAQAFYDLILTNCYQPVLASDGHKDCSPTNCVHKFWDDLLAHTK